uniref:Fascin domain-containing protein n=1 Tax=Plectus sambesii TaxID=2011161 RepID=A0A914WPZ9_9BILA
MQILILLVAFAFILDVVRCDASEIGSVYIKTHHGTYITTDPGHNARVYQSDSAGDSERFTVLKLDDGRYAFRTNHGTYLRAIDDGSVNTHDSMDSWGKFEKVEVDGKMAFITTHKTYLTAEEGAGAPIKADRSVMDAEQRFDFERA